MLTHTRGIVLRSVKYGETSLICTLFTACSGVCSFIVRGARSPRKNQASLLQPSSVLEIVLSRNPGKKIQSLQEFNAVSPASVPGDDVIKNCIAVFSAELLLRLLPENAPAPELFEYAFHYFLRLREPGEKQVANYPVFFVINCGRLMGYEPRGRYTPDTPYLHLWEGCFTRQPPGTSPFLSDEDTRCLDSLLHPQENPGRLPASASMRNNLLDWYLSFLHYHTQHLGTIRSLEVLRAILH